ncbi:hypothetical protein PVMG_06194, partial [Plasmodium vivax Mauritania I]
DYFKIGSVGLTLDKFYRTLNQDDNNLDDYRTECKSLLSENRHFKYYRLCQKLLRYLKSSSKISANNDSAYNECLLFNYWAYGELARRYVYKYDTKVNPAFGELNRVWNDLVENEKNLDYYNKCKPNFNIATQEDWWQRKELYNYCVNYKSLSQTANIYKDSCKVIYSYIKSYAPLYDHFKERCIPGSNYKCPEFYSKCEGYHPDTVLPLLDCHKDIKEEELSLAVKVPSKESPQYIPPRDTFSPDDLRLKNASSPPLTKAGDVLLGVVATAMTSGALYKFTPLGNILRNIFGWNNNMRNFNGGDNELFDYASEPFNPFSGGAEEHYIGYHPA